MSKFRLLFISIFIISLSILNAQETKIELNAKLPVDPKTKVGKLANGITYYIRKNDTPKNRAELTIAINAGSVLEDEDQQGLAHFCEHMAFNGTTNFPKHDLVNYLESIGMKFGSGVNAFTSFDETVYGIKVPLDSIEYLDKGLQILYDWGHNVSFDDEEIDKERGVIHEEWRMGQGAQDRMMRKYLKTMLYNSQYAKRLPIGTMDVVDNCKHDALKRYYKDWYRTDLMAVVVVGDFDPAMMEKKIIDLFGAMPETENPRERKTFEIPQHSETLVTIVTDKEAPNTMVQVLYKHPLFTMETVSDYKQSIEHELYNSMINKRLAELTLSATPPFIQGFSMYSSFLGPKNVYMSIALTQNEGVKEGLKAVLLENERLRKFGFTQTELDREKSSIMKKIEKMYNERNKMKSENLVREYTANFGITKSPIPGIEYEYELYKKLVPEITLEGVNKYTKEWITDENRVIVVQMPEIEGLVVPTEKEILDIVDLVKTEKVEAYVDKVSTKPLVETMPTAGKVEKESKNNDLETTEWTLSNGAKVIIKTTDFKDDEILLSAYSEGGLSLVSDNDIFSARIACDVIEESGLGSFDKIELDKYLSDKVANVSPYISELSEGFRGSSSIADFETMLQLIYVYFTKPQATETAYNSYVAKMKGVYENNSKSPDVVFRQEIQKVLSQNSMHNFPMNDTLLDKTSVKRIKYLFKKRFADPNNFTFVFVGNVDINTVKPLVEKYIGGLEKVERTETFADLKISAPKGKVDKDIKMGNDPKSIVFVDFSGDMEYNMKNNVNVEILGAILTLKLLESIREDQGGVYSIGAYPRTEKLPTSSYDMIVYYGCSPDNVEKLSADVILEMEKIKKNGPLQVDLDKAVEERLREREVSLRKNEYWLSTIKDYDFEKRKTDDFNKYTETLKALTKESIQKAAQKYLSTENYIRIVLKPVDK